MNSSNIRNKRIEWILCSPLLAFFTTHMVHWFSEAKSLSSQLNKPVLLQPLYLRNAELLFATTLPSCRKKRILNITKHQLPTYNGRHVLYIHQLQKTCPLMFTGFNGNLSLSHDRTTSYLLVFNVTIVTKTCVGLSCTTGDTPAPCPSPAPSCDRHHPRPEATGVHGEVKHFTNKFMVYNNQQYNEGYIWVYQLMVNNNG